MSGRQDESGTILIVTRKTDDHMGLIEPELAARGARVARLNTEQFVDDHQLVRFRAERGGAAAILHIDGEELDGDEVGAVLFRRLHIPTAADVVEGPARELAESELRAALEGALFSLDAHWVNHLHSLRLARHKLLQLRLAVDEGLTVPDSVVTSDPERIRSLFASWDGRMIAKLVGSQVVAPTVDEQYVVYTNLLEPDDLRDDATLAACPAMYQQLVEKDFELRVTVVGDELFTCRIDSQSAPDGIIDWRRANGLDITPHDLDAEVGRCCIAVTRRLGCEFAGIDLIVTPDGDHVFLEANAAGTWAWAQERTGLPIAAAIADNLLAGGRRVMERRLRAAA
jgi:glutathione synthase/RimK-type ligase-like ATP-grasp enzyme